MTSASLCNNTTTTTTNASSLLGVLYSTALRPSGIILARERDIYEMDI